MYEADLGLSVVSLMIEKMFINTKPNNCSVKARHLLAKTEIQRLELILLSLETCGLFDLFLFEQ